MFTYDLTDEDYALPYNAPGSSKSYFELDDEFRNFVPKRRSDAIKLETILGNSGDVDLETVGGPTGLSGEALDKGIRAYQKRNGLAVDGWVRPGGPTITKMKEQFGGLLGDYEAPSPKQSDTHHRMRDAGHQGFLKARRQDLLLPPIPGLPKPNENMRGGNHSLVRTVRDKGMQQTPDYMANLVRWQGQDGVVEARDFVDQLDRLMPGEGTKAIRGILGALADIPGLQRAFFGGPVIEIAPIGVFEQDGQLRYEQALKDRPWEEADRARRPGDNPQVRTLQYRPERDDVGLTERKLPYRPDAEAGKYEAIPLRATGSTEDAGAPPDPNDLLDPRDRGSSAQADGVRLASASAEMLQQRPPQGTETDGGIVFRPSDPRSPLTADTIGRGHDAQIEVPPVPAHKKDLFASERMRAGWEYFNRALGVLPNASANEIAALRDMYATEGGDKPHGTNAATTGITQTAFDDMKRRGTLPQDLRQYQHPRDIPADRRPELLRAYFDVAMRNAGGHRAFERIPDPDAAKALASTMAFQGEVRGATAIHNALRIVNPQENPDVSLRIPDTETLSARSIDAFVEAVADPKRRDAFLNALADERVRLHLGRVDRRGNLIAPHPGDVPTIDGYRPGGRSMTGR